MAIVLQKPSIVGIDGSNIIIAHPDISNYTRTYLGAPIAAAGTAMTVVDNNNFEDNDYFIIGEKGNAKTEENDVNGAVTRGTSITVTNSLKFGHELDAPVTRIFERKIAVYGASTDGGDLTEIVAPASAIDIAWDRPHTEYNNEGTVYAYYVVKFYDGTTLSVASDYVLAAGLGATSVQDLIDEALDMTGEEIQEGSMPKEYLLRSANACQDRIVHYTNKKGISKDWTFELIKDETSISIVENENEYALSGLTYAMKYTDSKQGILNVKLGTTLLKYWSIEDHDDAMKDNVKTYVKTEAAAAATSLVVDDSYEFDESGSLSVVGQSDPITYTANTESTGTFSGIPASGTGVIENTLSVDGAVWQGVTPGDPEKYTIFNGKIILNIPPDSDLPGFKLKFKYLKALTRFSDLSDTTEVTFSWIMPYFIASRIEERKGNYERADRLMNMFNKYLEEQAKKDKLYLMEEYEYRNMDI